MPGPHCSLYVQCGTPHLYVLCVVIVCACFMSQPFWLKLPTTVPLREAHALASPAFPLRVKHADSDH